jgi:hypothetical protein
MATGRRHPRRSRTDPQPLDQQGIRRRLEAAIAKQFGNRRKRPVQLALAHVVRRAGIRWDTFFKKLNGDRRIQSADAPLLARVFQLRPAWLVDATGPMWDERPLEPVVVSRGSECGTGQPSKGAGARPPKRAPLASVSRLGARVTGEAPVRQLNVRSMEIDEIQDLLAAAPRVGRLANGQPYGPRLELASGFLIQEVEEQAAPRHDVVEFLLTVVDREEEEARRRNPHYTPLRSALRPQLELLGMWRRAKPSQQPGLLSDYSSSRVVARRSGRPES